MKEELYFHVRENEKEDILAHSYCIRKTMDNRLLVGFSITHPNDNFCRKTGRISSKKKIDALNTISLEHFKNMDIRTILPYSISTSIESVIVKSKEMFEITNPVKVCTFIECKVPYTRWASPGVTISDTKITKIPAIDEFEI